MCAPLVFPSFYSFLGSALLFLVSLFLTTPASPRASPGSISLWMAAYLCACVWELAGAEINHSNGFALLLILS